MSSVPAALADNFHQLGTALEHQDGFGHAELGLFAGCRRDEHASRLLAIHNQEVQAQCSREAGLAILLGDLQICPTESTEPVGPFPSEEDVEPRLLPWEQLHWLCVVGRDTESLNEIDDVLPSVPIEPKASGRACFQVALVPLTCLDDELPGYLLTGEHIGDVLFSCGQSNPYETKGEPRWPALWVIGSNSGISR